MSLTTAWFVFKEELLPVPDDHIAHSGLQDDFQTKLDSLSDVEMAALACLAQRVSGTSNDQRDLIAKEIADRHARILKRKHTA